MRLLGWFPENADILTFASQELNLVMVLLVIIKLLQGFVTAQANVGYGSMIADVCDEHEYLTGRRQEGAFFAAVSFSAKATSGFGAVIAGLGLEFINWPTGPEIRTAADVPPQTITDLGLFYGPFIAALGFISVWFYSQYRLTPARHCRDAPGDGTPASGLGHDRVWGIFNPHLTLGRTSVTKRWAIPAISGSGIAKSGPPARINRSMPSSTSSLSRSTQ